MISRFENRTIEDLIADQARMSLGGGSTTTSLVRAYRDGSDGLRRVDNQLQDVVRQVGHEPTWHTPDDVVPAEIGAVDRDQARELLREKHRSAVKRLASDFEQGLEDAALANRVGTIEWFGERACRFHYFDRLQSRGLTTLRTRTIKNSHDLIDCRKIRVPAHSVWQPRKCQQLVRRLPAWLAKHSFVVVGTQIVADIEQVEETVEPNELAVAAKWVAGRVRRGAKAVADGVASAAGTFRELSTAIAPDPALVVGGSFVLCGWNEE